MYFRPSFRQFVAFSLPPDHPWVYLHIGDGSRIGVAENGGHQCFHTGFYASLASQSSNCVLEDSEGLKSSIWKDWKPSRMSLICHVDQGSGAGLQIASNKVLITPASSSLRRCRQRFLSTQSARLGLLRIENSLDTNIRLLSLLCPSINVGQHESPSGAGCPEWVE